MDGQPGQERQRTRPVAPALTIQAAGQVGFDVLADGLVLAPIRLAANDAILADSVVATNGGLRLSEFHSRDPLAVTFGSGDYISISLPSTPPARTNILSAPEPVVQFKLTILKFNAARWNSLFPDGPAPFQFLACAMPTAQVWHQRGWLNATPYADSFPLLQDVHIGSPEISCLWNRNWSYICPLGALVPGLHWNLGVPYQQSLHATTNLLAVNTSSARVLLAAYSPTDGHTLDQARAFVLDDGTPLPLSGQPVLAWRGWPQIFTREILMDYAVVPPGRLIRQIDPRGTLLMAASTFQGSPTDWQPVQSTFTTAAADYSQSETQRLALLALQPAYAQLPPHRIAVQNILPSLPQQFPFPSGDPRLRSVNRGSVNPAHHYVPLLTVRDAQGHSYGDAAAYIEFRTGPAKGGKVLYIWSTLLSGPQGTSIMANAVTWILNATLRQPRFNSIQRPDPSHTLPSVDYTPLIMSPRRQVPYPAVLSARAARVRNCTVAPPACRPCPGPFCYRD